MNDKEKRAKRAADIAERKRRLEELRRLRGTRKNTERAAAARKPDAVKKAPEASEDFEKYLDGLLSAPKPVAKAEEPAAEKGGDGKEAVSAALGGLSVAPQVTSVSRPARPKDTYHVDTQTDESYLRVAADAPSTPAAAEFTTPRSSMRPKRQAAATASTEASTPATIPETPGDGEVKEESLKVDVLPRMSDMTTPGGSRIATEDEAEAALQSKGFSSFLERASKLMSRALAAGEVYDIAADHFAGEEKVEGKRELLTKQHSYFDERVASGRPVMDVEWSPHTRGLFLVAYGDSLDDEPAAMGGGAPDRPEGLVLVWSIAMPKRPEVVLTCHSPVLIARFHPFAPSRILGGLYCGQVVMWNTTKQTTPLLRTSLKAGHAHPVFSMELMGTSNASSIVSVSTDGLLCVWNSTQFAEPTVSKQLIDGHSEVNVTVLAIPSLDSSKVLVGAEDGGIFIVQLRGSDTAIKSRLKGHSVPVTAICPHPNTSTNLVLSSSVDWSVRLWNISETTEKPLLATFDAFSDYVYDVKWSPTHPTMFTAVDGTGGVTVWNINEDLETHVYRASVGDVGEVAASRVQWASDSRTVLVGVSDGSVVAYDFASELISSRPDDLAVVLERLDTVGVF